MAKVFISRDLTPDSSFRLLLESEGWSVHGESLLQIDPVPFTDLPETDWVFFYSKNAVRYYFEGLQNPKFWAGKKLRQGPPRKKEPIKYAAYGSGTASYLRIHHKVPVHFIGSARPKSTAEALVTMAAGQRILFPRARHSRHSLYKYLRYTTKVQEVIVYDNYIREEFEIPPCDVLVFTSPLNAKSYFQKYTLQKNQSVIAIGHTTARKLKSLGVKKVMVAKKPGEEELVKVVRGI